MESINMKQELALYNLDGKWNDYIGVQKEVLSVLQKESFFENNDVINLKTGMNIRINAKVIKETIGKGKRFQTLPKKLKVFKISTIRHLKEIIKNADIVKDNVKSIHEENGYMFAYLKSEILIDGENVKVRISVKKKVSSNWFWIHNIDEKEK